MSNMEKIREMIEQNKRKKQKYYTGDFNGQIELLERISEQERKQRKYDKLIGDGRRSQYTRHEQYLRHQIVCAKSHRRRYFLEGNIPMFKSWDKRMKHRIEIWEKHLEDKKAKS